MSKDKKHHHKAEDDNQCNPFCEEEKAQEAAQEEARCCEAEEKLKAEIDDLNNRYLRLAADFDNYRKRQAQEKQDLLEYGAAETLTKIITAIDTIERAQEQIEKIEDVNIIKESYNVVIKQLMDILQKCGLEKIETQGQKFDPNFHEAVAQTPTNEYEDQTIISQAQTGYKMKDRVLRPSMVIVAVSEGNN